MNRFFVIFLLLFIVYKGEAQEYKQSAGVRLGTTAGLTYKSFLIQDEAIEILISGRKKGIQATLTYVFHMPIEFSFNENFYAYYGIGGHLGYEEYGKLNKSLISLDPPLFEFEDKVYYVMGADAILGLEYRWLSVPITIGFDIKPYFNFIGLRYTSARFWDSAISVKYIF